MLRSRPFVTPEKDEEESARLGSLEGTAFGTHTSSCPAMWNTPEYALLYYVPSATKHLSSSFPSLIASCRWHRQRRGKCTRSDAAHTCLAKMPKKGRTKMQIRNVNYSRKSMKSGIWKIYVMKHSKIKMNRMGLRLFGSRMILYSAGSSSPTT